MQDYQDKLLNLISVYDIQLLLPRFPMECFFTVCWLSKQYIFGK